ncbi:sensor histidine kinase [Caballeronia insecticola]|uniref:histidine kinase n=1 Tax=Caballeronia insecticola TaxID=758793 RepID=R4WYZ3_9BURK|nr:ATP-binding protein [Caballeronia insecticola]BAN24601.1 histidine kinase [Caballeronia insecticola]
MNPSAVVTLDESPIESPMRRASLRGVSSPAPECAGASSALPSASPWSALIDAKLKGDRQIQRLAARVQELAALLAATEERARRALAQDLHDETGAALTVANLALARAAHWLPEDAPAALGDALHQARAALADVSDTSHRIVEALQTPAFDAGIAATLDAWIDSFRARTAISVDFSCPRDARLQRLSHDMSLALLRVMQEALGNVARHADAARARVSIEIDGDGVTLIVEDDGVGISAAARRKSGRFGLAGMRARCEALGGSLRVVAAKPAGTCVRARLPWAAARPGLFALSVIHA